MYQPALSLCINPHCKKQQNFYTLLFCKGCGSELLIDGRYRAIGELGQGGCGKTYEVLDLHSQPKVLKVLLNNHPKYVELFQQEAEVLGLLNHPGIPKLDLDGYFLFFPRSSQEPLHCIVMEKIEGLNLEEYIYQRGNYPINQKRALRWLAELSLILEQVHNHDFFHRDIKPANIMLRANGLLAMIDFGTARQIDADYLEKQALGEVTGVMTAGYTPIEQMRGRAVRQSDFYALGGTMIFLLTAHNPSYFYSSHDNKINWRGAVRDISDRFANLIDRLISASPEDRPQTAQEILRETVAIDPSLQGLGRDFGSGSISPISSIPSSIPSTNLSSSLSLEFIQRCRQELAEFIGPMAGIICDRTLAQNPNLSQTELVKILALKIPNAQQANAFMQRLL